MTSKSGFTLIEILVVLAILGLTAGLIFPNFNFWQKQSSLDAAAQEIVSALRLAQSQTLASEGASVFGVYFETDKFTLFKGVSFYPSSPDNNIHPLNSSLKIAAINLGGVNFAVFDRLTGRTANYGYVRIEQASDASRSKTIFLDASGIISYSSQTPTDQDRQKDSRHTEFSYSQNAQNATTLSLYFPDGNITENINYQSFLNADKSAFAWDGTVMVQGKEQTIEVHTHSLTSADAIFCVHRDRRVNTQALMISLDGQNLINYSATGTSTRGTSPWAGEPLNQ